MQVSEFLPVQKPVLFYVNYSVHKKYTDKNSEGLSQKASIFHDFNLWAFHTLNVINIIHYETERIFLKSFQETKI